MSNKEQATYFVKKKNLDEVETLTIVLKLYALTVLDKELSPREVTVLRDYIINGYSKQTKEGIRLSLGISEANLNTLNCSLQSKGFLKPHKTNQRKKELGDAIEHLKQVFLNRSKKTFLIQFTDAI